MSWTLLPVRVNQEAKNQLNQEDFLYAIARKRGITEHIGRPLEKVTEHHFRILKRIDDKKEAEKVEQDNNSKF